MDKFYLLTILKEKKLHANVYDNKDNLLKDITKFQKLPMRLFELTKTEQDEYDLCVIKIGEKYIAGLGAKEKIKNDKYFTKTMKREIGLEEL